MNIRQTTEWPFQSGAFLKLYMRLCWEPVWRPEHCHLCPPADTIWLDSAQRGTQHSDGVSGLHEAIKGTYWTVLNEATDPANAEQGLRQLVADLEQRYPSAAACLTDDLPALCIHLTYFPRLRKRLRSSNLLERALEEVRHRTKVIGRFPR